MSDSFSTLPTFYTLTCAALVKLSLSDEVPAPESRVPVLVAVREAVSLDGTPVAQQLSGRLPPTVVCLDGKERLVRQNAVREDAGASHRTSRVVHPVLVTGVLQRELLDEP